MRDYNGSLSKKKDKKKASSCETKRLVLLKKVVSPGIEPGTHGF